MSRKRLSKTQLKRDRFVEQTFEWAHWAETHRNQVIAGLVAVAVVVAGFFVYRNMSRTAEARAAEDYMEARQALFSGNYPLAASDLQSFATRHGGSSFADDARFFRAWALYQAEQYGEAARALTEFLDRHGDSPFADNARWLLAAAYEGAGEMEQAVAAYREAIEDAGYEELEVELREGLAAVYEAQGRTDLAVEEYRTIVDLEPDAAVSEEARRKLAEIQVEPLAGGEASKETSVPTETGSGDGSTESVGGGDGS